MDLISRRDAHASNSSKYFTGKACKHGHVCQRWTASGACVICQQGMMARYKRKPVGLVRMIFDLHPDDVEGMKASADALNRARVAHHPGALDAIARTQSRLVSVSNAKDPLPFVPGVGYRLAPPPPPPVAPLAPCAVCNHPTQVGHECVVCGTVLAP